jgi:hypothetical protein
VRIDTNGVPFSPATDDRQDVGIVPLFRDRREDVRLERWAPGAAVGLAVPGGMEILVLEGSLEEGGEVFEPQSWLRLPAGATLRARAGAGGCKIWVKSGHLAGEQLAPGTRG